jgi:glycine/D-amino acid oxidase-like deaminating enzyme
MVILGLWIDGCSLVQLVVERDKRDAPELSRGERFFRQELRKNVITEDLDLPEDEAMKRVNALKNKQAVWDKEVLWVDQRKYGEALAELFEEWQVTDNLPKQKKIKVCSPPLSP